jgi:imidazoleglycerol phosphate synthase glutamine amidotransferase subunit HisH
MKLIAIYNDETMTVKYKNIMMTQWHPENSIDGIKILNHWLSLKNKQH